MSEADIIAKTKSQPNTKVSLKQDLKKLGLTEGMTLIVHSSLSSLGWICGGIPTLILALEESIGEKGTLVMPAHSGDLSDPAEWSNPPVPESWFDAIRENMPVFQSDLTPCRGIGQVAETFRKQQGVVRSSHPQYSFSAWGKNKDFIIQDNHYDFAQNEKSPLGRLYELNASILLIGVGYCNNTSLHLAEYKADYPAKKFINNGMPILENGTRQWRYFDDIEMDSEDFERIGSAYEEHHTVITGKLGQAECRLIQMQNLVDFAVDWMNKNRSSI